jgi:two-component system NarL family sensor kinase
MLFGFAVAEVAIAVAAGFACGLSWDRLVALVVVPNAIIGMAMAVAGWPIAAHRPGNPLGWLLLAAGCSYPSSAAGATVLAWAHRHGWQGSGWRVIATLTDAGWGWSLALFLPLIILLFPDGSLLSRRWWPLVAVIAANGSLMMISEAVSNNTISGGVGYRGYLSWSGYDQHLSWVDAVLQPSMFLSYFGVQAAMILRFRRGAEQVRRQILWVLLALLIVVGSFVLSPVLPNSALLLAIIAVVPISIALAVWRRQLLDIRLVFSRSLVYLLLTAGVIATYLATVTVLQQGVSRTSAWGPSVLATLVIAAAFNPVRLLLQRVVDRAVYGARRDPVRAVAEVGARLGQIGAAPDMELDGVLEALCQVMRLPWARIVITGRTVAEHGDPTPVRHEVPLWPSDERRGELILGLRPGETTLNAADAQVLSLLVAPTAVAVHASALAEEVARSREQVILAREEERRRLRRDLHDGLGPVLTGVVLNADAARRLLPTDPRRSAELLADLRDQTTGVLEEIRRLVYELRPPALESLGLIGALQEHAVVLSRRADGEPLQVEIDVPVPLCALPAAVEVAAYRIVTEALTNVTRHSNASTATVSLDIHDHGLRVRIHDDGVNLGRGWEPGLGLTSIRERAAELGGRCSIEHDRTGGRVAVCLPLPGLTTTATVHHPVGIEATP